MLPSLVLPSTHASVDDTGLTAEVVTPKVREEPGPVTLNHLWPFQRMINVSGLEQLSVRPFVSATAQWRPTAHTLDDDCAVTLNRRESSRPGFGI